MRQLFVQCGAIIAAIVAFAIWGIYSDQQVEKDRQATRAKFQVAPEFITTRDLQAPGEIDSVTSGKYARVSDYWVTTETQDWLLLNGPRGTALCQQVLGNFGDQNAPAEVMDTARMRVLAEGFKGRALELQVHIPRFKTTPAGLEQCPGFRFDAASGLLNVGDRHVAYLDEAQPRLTNHTTLQ